MSRTKVDLIAFAVSSLLSALLFMVVYLLTFTYRGAGHGVSGNGNPAILFVFPAIPVYLAAVVFTYRISRRVADHAPYRKRARLALLIFVVLCGLGEYAFVDRLIRHLGGGPANPDSAIYHFGWLNQYTNTIYFNAYTFLIGLSLAALTALGVKRISR
ncbi:hypothetical protein [Paenibacillus methanolicus]|uniref:Uncharacterized protein n=1 Tax=Paenibacillus methanolicus TaxID=582686 RepID=A0A5S5C3W5_9BACL|nr:hypothetical protein [Paenibacillus methanolicus]TYP73308.1 hypothetical protein BCM02_107292 [Paenibacillus methanolicus]